MISAMTASDWVALLGVAVTLVAAVIGFVVKLVARLEDTLKGWGRDMFADKADVAKVEQRVASLESAVGEVKDDLRLLRADVREGVRLTEHILSELRK